MRSAFVELRAMKSGAHAWFLVILLAYCAWTQPGSKPRPENEWDEAYHLARVARSDRPKNGFVPNAEIAERIAEAVASGLYGESTAAQERPFRARLNGDIWTVMGTLPHLSLGGVAIVQINRDDGRILFAHHTQ